MALLGTRIGLVCGIMAIACGCGSSQPAPRAPELPRDWQAKCSVAKSRSRPLIVEWPSTDRAALESAAQRGLVVVRYVGCEMELLPRCRVEGSYRYTPVTLQSDRITIRNLDELYANVPLGAAKLEGELSARGELNVDLVIVGTYDATEAHRVERGQLRGDCAGATHVLSSMTAGAFTFYSGAATSAGGGVGALGFGAGAKHGSARSLLSQSGDATSCRSATRQDEEPPEACGALLRVETVELAPQMGSVAIAPEPSSEPSSVGVSAGEHPSEAREGAGDILPPKDWRPVRLSPGFMLGIRGPFFVSFGSLEEGVPTSSASPLSAGAQVELGYRTRPEIAVVATTGLNHGTSKGISPNDLCTQGVTCAMTQAELGLALHANDPAAIGVWAEAAGIYSFTRFSRSGTASEGDAGEYDTSMGYHAAGGSLRVGWDWTDSYVAQIRYGLMLSYTLARVLSGSGRNVIGGNDMPLGGDYGFIHGILIGGRFHGDFGATR